MKAKDKLKDFQWNTVAAILSRFKEQSVYSIADEVGLGKTLVVAETILQTFLESKRKRFVVYYVASSQELILQNIHAVSKYIMARLKEVGKDQVGVLSYQSRLTRILLDESRWEESSKQEGKTSFIHIIGLTPNTSFKIRGKGSVAERMSIAPLFAYKKYAQTQVDIIEWFYALDGRDYSYISRWFERFKKMYGNSLKDLSKDLMKDVDVYNEYVKIWNNGGPKYWKKNRKEHYQQLSCLREKIIDATIFKGDTRCDFLILDEWHKYSNFCLNEKENLNKLITKLRNANNSKTLLVSATPFKVDYQEVREDGKVERKKSHSTHFEDIYKVIFGENYLFEYKRFQDSRVEYISSVTDYVASYNIELGDKTKKLSLDRRHDYLNRLSKIVIRTERPRIPPDSLRDINELASKPSWDIVKPSLNEFLKKYDTFKDKEGKKPTRSPIQSMFLDGSTFPDNYPSITGKTLCEENWKIKSLRSYLEDIFNREPFSLKLPPLWLPVGDEFSKTLIFSHFTFTPGEICNSFQYQLVTDKAKKKSGTIFGKFPLKLKKVSKMEGTYHWPYFYTPIYLELDEVKYLTTIEIDKVISGAASMYEAVYECERRLVESNDLLLERLEMRFSHLDKDSYSFKQSIGREMLYSVFTEDGGFTLGKALISIMKKNLAKINICDSKLEKRLMSICYWFSNLFVHELSQQIYDQLKKRYKKKPFDKKNISLDYVTWYCSKFKFLETFTQYFELLSHSYGDVSDILYEFYSSMALKGSTQYGKYYRPFLDSKESARNDEEGEAYSQKTIRNAFNSPFPPYLLVSTSIGQEGLDFHRYCDSIIHWTPPSSPSSLQQREGRIDRYLSKQVRKSIFKNGIDQEKDELGGLHPNFTVVREGKRLNKPNRFVLFLPFSSQARAWNRCLQRMYYNDILIGHPDPLSIEKILLSKVESLDESVKERLYVELKDLFIDLKPVSISDKELSSLKNI